MRPLKCIVTSYLFLLWLGSGVFAYDTIYFPVAGLSKVSDAIVEGTVTKVEMRWDADHRMIYTYATVKINVLHKGNIPQQEIIIKERGGKLDGAITYGPGIPIYRTNESVFLFLFKDKEYYRTMGEDQGKFNIEMVNGVKKLRRDIKVDEFLIINKNVSKNDIRSIFIFDEVKALIDRQ